MFGASQFMVTSGRSRLRPANLARPPFRPTRRHVRCYGPGSAVLAIRCPIVCRFLAQFARAPVAFELWTIALVRARYVATPISRAVLQIVLGRAIVWATAILIGAA
jgi:hypothetical protein